jgi:Cellulase (glycosyl hydrolase family 5)
LASEANRSNETLYFVSSEPKPPFIAAAPMGSIAGLVTPNAIRPLRGLGVVAKIGQNVESDDKQFELMRVLGVDLVCWVPGEWAGNEQKPGVYALTPEVRRMVSKIAAANMRMIVVLFRKNALYKNPTDPAAFARYAAWMAVTLKDAPVAAYQIWNEPGNFDVREQYGGSWNGRGDAPWVGQFSEIVRQAAAAIRRVDPKVTIIHNLDGPPWVYAMQEDPEDFKNVDGVGLHPYTFRLPPESVPWGGIETKLRDGVSVADPDHSLLSYLRIQTAEDPEKLLGRRLTAWVTEFGFPTCDAMTAKGMFACVSPEVQAAYHVRAVIQGLSNQVSAWCVYEMADDGNDRSNAEQNFGLVQSAESGFRPKPAFYAIRRTAILLGKSWHPLEGRRPRLESVPGSISGPLWKESGSATASTTKGIQMYWFRTDAGYTGFIWYAGPYSETATTGRLEWPSAPAALSTSKTRLIDIVSGRTVASDLRSQGDTLIIDRIPISSRPIAIQVSTS